MTYGRIHSYETFGAVDGPGLRFVVFLQGCPLRCLYCHNPDTWDAASGTQVSVDEVVSKILKYKGYYKNGGVTLSGGEPFLQHEFVYELLTALKAQGMHTAVDTSGAIPLEQCRKAVDAADMLLLDIKTYDQSLCARLTGNGEILRREIALLKYCEEVGKPVWVRHVVVPGLTLDMERLEALGKYLRGFECVKRVEPLPFHKLGEHKWNPELYTLADVEPPSLEDMAEAERLLKK